MNKLKFEECFAQANEAIIENASNRFFHINQLIKAKKATNRSKNQLDVEELEKIKKRTNET